MIETLLILLGVSVSFGLFIYFLSSLDGAGRKLHPVDKAEAGKDREDPRLVFGKKWESEAPRPRICPLCGTYLNKSDYLYAAMGPEVPPDSARKRQVKIYGCPYCYPEKREGLTRTEL